jgi:hypothetical protein
MALKIGFVLQFRSPATEAQATRGTAQSFGQNRQNALAADADSLERRSVTVGFWLLNSEFWIRSFDFWLSSCGHYPMDMENEIVRHYPYFCSSSEQPRRSTAKTGCLTSSWVFLRPVTNNKI